ncbi:Oidioi.mRNA.OKI2018_I69.XSR.g16931.t1.cds [Oikopleura dioica]|uniref:Oidioi.mRNA.OKI2018_I69.XSR.g16931.t1.cds n=1 Tax=Oikopleura dioica TaxID=34765 RepID=A0ABN7SMC6_OIKDI|nr:Oidioi.mRNA.OKI2018_I69.XSR.g16931.t1.cds [Oikopleura dioica]
MSLEELYSLYEKNVNVPNRKKTLNAISDHPNANLLGELIFNRMTRTDYVSAKSQLLPIEDNEHGPFDHLLGAHQCDWILELMAREDYVIDLLKDEFLVKYDREPSSLSDIVKIAAQREKISKNQSVPKAVFETRHDTCQMGSTWIVTFHKINGVDEQQRTLPNVYVHKIVRAPEIRLERLRLPINYRRRVLCVLYEPFLIVFESEKRIDFFNLLKPNEQPKSLTGEGEFMKPEGYYQADVRRNGKILDDVIFPIVRKKDARTICVDFALITRLSVDIILQETIKLPEKDVDSCDLHFLDRHNFLLTICFVDDEDLDNFRGCAAFLIIPAKKKIVSYYLPELSGVFDFPEYGMVDERCGLIVWDAAFNDDDDDHRIAAYGLLSEKIGLEVICFFKLPIDEEIYMEEDLILQFNQAEGKFKTVSFKALINHLEEMGQAMPSLTRPVNGCIVTRPIVEIEKLRSEGFVKDVCKVPETGLCLTLCNIGRIIWKPSGLMEIQIFV